MAMNLGTAHPVAKKKHRCGSCGGAIQPGDRYVRARVVDGREAWVWKSHDDCQAASQILYDQGFDNDGMLICVSDMDDDDREIVATASASLALRLWPTHPNRRDRQRGEEGGMRDPLKTVPPKEQRRLLALERKFRASGEWGPWETIPLTQGQGGDGWAGQCHQVRRNRVFAVLVRLDASGVVHLAVSSLSGIRPSWPEMQRIKDDIAGPDATAIEVYPPRAEVVDEADMFHIWVLRGKLPFGLHLTRYAPGLRSPVEVSP